jgi:hypothetical protein
MPEASARYKVLFLRTNGKEVDVWYTFESQEDAERFAKQVRDADKALFPKVVIIQ